MKNPNIDIDKNADGSVIKFIPDGFTLDSEGEIVDEKVEYAFQEALKDARAIAAKNKFVAVNPAMREKYETVMADLEFLLKDNGWEYEIKTKRNECFPDLISIQFEVECFSTSIKTHQVFRNIIKNTDSFGADYSTNDKVSFSFSIHDYFIPNK